MKKSKTFGQVCCLLLCFITVNELSGQIAESVVYYKGDQSIESRFACADQDAGSREYGVGTGGTDDFNPGFLALDPRMLTFCYNDRLQLFHNGDGDLSGDPDMSTPPGYGYAIYTCAPSITGPTLQDIETDPCILRNVAGEIQIYTGEGGGVLSGDVDFFNEGFFQGLNGGDPVQMWFALITYDAYNGSNAVYEGSPSGPCVSVNVADSFSVLYLNEIVIDVLDNDVLCGGELRITGGMPEYYDQARVGILDQERYDVNIFNMSDPTLLGEKCLGGRPVHDEEFFFMVPEAGMYRIVVSDAKGCNVADVIMDINCETLDVTLGQNANVSAGDVHCVEISVDNFIDISGLQWHIEYDPAVLQLIPSSITRHSSLTAGTLPIVETQPGVFAMNLFDINFNTYSIVNGGDLATLCFDVIGNEGDCTDVQLFAASTVQISTERNFCQVPISFTPSIVCLRSTTIDAATCSTPAGTTGGSIIFGPTVGTPGFTYLIEDDANPGTVIGSGTFTTVPDTIEHQGFGPGTYNITITDANGQQEIATVTIQDAPRIMIDSLIPTNPSCVGISDGEINLFTSGGISPNNSQWTGPNGYREQDINTITGLEAGMYNVRVTDADGCPATSMRNLFTDSIFVDIMADRFTSCPGGSDGRVFAQARGGTAPYDFAWNGGTPVLDQFSHILLNAPSGQQVLILTDANGCSIRVDTFSLGSLNELDVDSTFNDITCFGQNDGAININPISGVGPYTFDWNDIGLGNMDRSGLSAGDYTVTVTDSEGCFDSLQFMLTSPDSLNVFLDSTLTSSFVCFGDMNGRIVLNAVGGDLSSAPPVVQWTPNVSDNFGAVNLGGGTYDILVTDALGCQDLTTHTIQEATEIDYTVPTLAEPNCPGDSTALTVINASGGAGGPYLFNVNGGRDYLVDSTILQVPAGTYTIEVTDTIGCSALSIVSVVDPDPITIDLPEEIIINLGDSSLFLSPDIRPLAQRDSIVNYQWTPTTGLSCDSCAMTGIYVTQSGTYTLTITDVNGCMYSEDIQVRSRKIRNVYIPNAFTPNGDGDNPLFIPITGQGVNQIRSFRIFNRWGDMVYNEFNIPGGVNGQLFGWDGTDNEGRDLPIGVYVYAAEVDFVDGIVITYKGDVTLLR